MCSWTSVDFKPHLDRRRLEMVFYIQVLKCVRDENESGWKNQETDTISEKQGYHDNPDVKEQIWR